MVALGVIFGVWTRGGDTLVLAHSFNPHSSALNIKQTLEQNNGGGQQENSRGDPQKKLVLTLSRMHVKSYTQNMANH